MGAALFIPSEYAHADDLSDAKASLDAASKQLDSINAEYEKIQGEISALEEKMSSTTNKVMEAQNAMLKGQNVLGEAVKASYKNEGASSLVSVFLMSEDLGDFLKNITYYSAIQEDQAKLVEDQKELRNQFQAVLGELEEEKAQQERNDESGGGKKTGSRKSGGRCFI